MTLLYFSVLCGVMFILLICLKIRFKKFFFNHDVLDCLSILFTIIFFIVSFVSIVVYILSGCPKCHHIIGDTEKYCTECGYDKEQYKYTCECGYCYNTIINYCPECGKDLSE